MNKKNRAMAELAINLSIMFAGAAAIGALCHHLQGAMTQNANDPVAQSQIKVEQKVSDAFKQNAQMQLEKCLKESVEKEVSYSFDCPISVSADSTQIAREIAEDMVNAEITRERAVSVLGQLKWWLPLIYLTAVGYVGFAGTRRNIRDIKGPDLN